jgi:enterochelin esterase-like enzyme
MVLACPVTPNPYRAGGARAIARYADWIEEVLLPAVRERAPMAAGPEGTGLDGCSLGGYVAVEVFLRKPELFATLGSVQGALNTASAVRYADGIARAIERVGARPLHLETSSDDPYRRANEALSRALRERGVPNELRVPPGPHDQPWLREVGTLELLLWHERQLSGNLECKPKKS